MKPDIDIIDLDRNEEKTAGQESAPNTEFPEAGTPGADAPEADAPEAEATKPENPTRKKRSRFLNIHVLFAAAAVLIIAIIIMRFNNWGTMLDLDEIMQQEGGDDADVLDMFLPGPAGRSNDVNGDGEVNMLAFGNAPFADDRDSDDNLVNLIAKEAGIDHVYNCSVSGSYLAARNYAYDYDTEPMDAYCLYWLSVLLTSKSNDYYYINAEYFLGDACPPEAHEVYETLTSIDMNTVDLITIMYDATDYYMGSPMYSDENDTDICQFTGNLEASIELLQTTYPNVRIIVLSPTYAFGVDENGDYVSSDIKTYGQDVLSTYVIKEYASCVYRSVSFVDNLYGTVTEDNAKHYLKDNVHLNLKGRKKVAERFMEAFNRYTEE